ncbi:SGNH/GDSL hydrolase family protein [Kribbella sp. NBC_01245]|uniref:SGNH/GDSL hydrolase family protein n=1 Tax=Kribbella sp. NBC_01245 TaxID=2903578 RepID=UPI002E28D9FC|nr:SGNH/GDSL hydrolase family protein [Kribbella sp. NBC_01245]
MKISRSWQPVAASVVLALVGSTAITTSAETGSGNREWVGTWAAAVTHGNAAGSTNAGLNNQSVRLNIRTSIGGDQLRVRLTNIYGEQAVAIGAATIARPNKATPELSDIDPATVRTLTFNGGSATATMNKGAELLSDPVDLKLNPLEELLVSVYFPTPTGPTTFHSTTNHHNFVGPTNLTAEAGGAGYTLTRTCCWFFVSGVDVQTKKAPGSIVVLADSLGDGNGSTFNGNNRWPDQLAERLNQAWGKKAPGILNASLAGSRLNHEGNEPGAGGFPGFNELGVNGLARVNEDVFGQTGVKTVITDLGINDIWMSNDSADAIIASLRQINAQAKEKGLRSIVATLAPYEGTGAPGVWTPEKDATRNAVNAYLRSSDEFDGLIDFDAILRDPTHPSRLLPAYDSGDHIHPNDAGYQAVANAIDLKLLK